jgi:hypothetical protein
MCYVERYEEWLPGRRLSGINIRDCARNLKFTTFLPHLRLFLFPAHTLLLLTPISRTGMIRLVRYNELFGCVGKGYVGLG